ncbi:MAG TPA: type I-F CRISPR-associated protein Csy1 [Burkholderiaceae bacterium]|nr:type I-F CRISPR-associated protein Csy1 [Burkholderiaceae bacterium]
MSKTLPQLIREYIDQRAATKLEQFDKEVAKDATASGDYDSSAAIVKRQELLASFEHTTWLTDAARRAKQISFVTHPIKFTHSDAKGSSIYALGGGDNAPATYVTTSTLKHPSIDVDGNAAALDVAGLLQLAADGTSVGQRVAEGDISALASFAENDAQLEDWRLGFAQALTNTELRTHTLAKQVYIPLPAGSYHLVSPLFASSLAQEVYTRISDSRFSEESKELRRLRKEKCHSSQTLVEFRDIALQAYGGTKPQNVSKLNSSRRGSVYLVSCEPPSWKKISQPPQDHDVFWRGYERLVWATLRRLVGFLKKLPDDANNLHIRNTRAEFVDELIEQFLLYSTEIQTAFKPGWSIATELTREERFWLDPWFSDEGFQQERASSDWQRKLAEQFAFWLNRKLSTKKMLLADTEYHEWRKLLERKLGLLQLNLEALSS